MSSHWNRLLWTQRPMGRMDLRCLVFTWAALLLCGQGVGAEAADRVDAFDLARGQRVVHVGTIRSEDAVRIALTTQAGVNLTIPTASVLEVAYDDAPAELLLARNQERQRNWAAAIEQYEAASRSVGREARLLRRHIEFKRAEMLALRAEDTDRALAERAAGELRRWLQENPSARQSLRAIEMLHRVDRGAESGSKDAAAMLQGLRNTAPQDPELNVACDWLQIQWDIEAAFTGTDRAEGLRALEPRLAALTQKPDRESGSLAPVLVAARAWLAVAVAAGGKVDDALTTLDQLAGQHGSDRRALAQVHLCRGLVLRGTGRPREALWEFAWVEVVYAEEPTAKALALLQLAEVQRELDQPRRARVTLERLKSDSALMDTWPWRLAQRSAQAGAPSTP